MINSKEAVHAFKNFFDDMSYEEREKYLESNGFSFGEKSQMAFATAHRTMRGRRVNRDCGNRLAAGKASGSRKQQNYK